MSSNEDEAERAHFMEVLRAFVDYEPYMFNDTLRRKRHLGRLPLQLQNRMPGGKKGNDATLSEMLSCARANAAFLNQVAGNVNFYHRNFNTHPSEWCLSMEEVSRLMMVKSAEDLDHRGYVMKTAHRHLAKVRGTLHQCAREWSSVGKKERDECYTPLLKQLDKYLPVNDSNRNKQKVLIPGSGLGRLVLESCARGYSTQGNEFDYFMLMTCNLMLNSTEKVNQFKIFPWINDRCNIYNRRDVMKPVLIPDVCPMDLVSKNPEGHDMSMCAGEFLEVYGKQSNAWNAVLACFFIDTAPNIFDYMEVIHRILKPGGLLISIGPLQFHWAEDFGDDERYSRSIEMSYDEIKHVIQSYGFEFLHEERRKCSYARNPESMQQSSYHVVQFTARKVVKKKSKQ